jgi:uncharacterized iron-regulated membrane protein
MTAALTLGGLCWLASGLILVAIVLWEERRPVKPARQYPPPVPPSRPRVTQADILATWNLDLPVDCLSDEEVRLRAEQIEAAEDFDWLPGTWAE